MNEYIENMGQDRAHVLVLRKANQNFSPVSTEGTPEEVWTRKVLQIIMWWSVVSQPRRALENVHTPGIWKHVFKKDASKKNDMDIWKYFELNGKLEITPWSKCITHFFLDSLTTLWSRWTNYLQSDGWKRNA